MPKRFDNPKCCKEYIIYWATGGVKEHQHDAAMKAWYKRVSNKRATVEQMEEPKPYVGPPGPGWVYEHENGECIRVNYCPFCGQKLTEES